MGIKDFDGIFDGIDLARKGFLTAAQLHDYCEVLFCAPICLRHVEDAIKLKSASPGMVSKKDFLPVFQDVQRRKAVEEQAYWDFQALDFTGSSRISLKDTLILFREIHGSKFSLATWRRFLSSRLIPADDVYFDEIRFWLCSIPIGSPCSDKEFKEEMNRLELKQIDDSYASYSDIKYGQEDEFSLQKEKEEHEEEVNRHALRKLNKWNKQGVEAMLFDDGLEAEGGEVKVRSKNNITMGDLNELLEMKYDALRERLMQEMVKEASALEEEQRELLQQLRRQGKQLMKEWKSVSDSDVSMLPGAMVQMPSTLIGLMGELRREDREHRVQMEELKNRLRNEGKRPQEVVAAVKAQYEQFISGDNSCGGLLLQVIRRYHQERDTMLSLLQTETNQPLAVAMAVEYGRLMRQLLVMEEELKFVPMATAAGLAERAIDPKPDRFDWDRSRSERLAQIRLLERKDRKQMKTPDAGFDEVAMETSGVVDVQMEVVREVTRKHFYEREALIAMLQGKESGKWREQARKMKTEERKRQLQAMRSQHQAWKSHPKGDNSFVQTLLKEAVWLKSEERRLELEVAFPNISDTEICEVMLADLQQRQGVDCEALLQTVQNQGKPELLLILRKECKLRVDEHYDNIAYITLGTVEVSPEDEEYVKVLDSKYEALRRRIILMTLRDQFGAAWKEMSREEKQQEMKERKKTEKTLRGEGKFREMEELLGPRAKMLPSLRGLMGEEKLEFQQRLSLQQQTGSNPDETPSNLSAELNVLADLVPRHDNEQGFLLSWLQSPEAKGLHLRSRRMKIVQMKVEMVRVEMEEDFELAAISSGLAERVVAALSDRHASDRDRQVQLSRKRVQLRRKRVMEKEEFRKEPEIDKSNIPKKGDITGLQVVYLHEMLKRHRDERELMLQHLQDESIDDLLEAASMMTRGERQRRLAELQGKRQTLGQGDKEENVAILEEAAAIRAVCIREEMSALASSVTMEAVAVELLAELQDEQDKELAQALQDIDSMREDDLRTTFYNELDGRRQAKAWNVLLVLTRYQGEASDEDLLKALELKYKTLQDKLLTDSLVGRLGNDSWQKLSYKEKQQKLAALRAQAREHQRSGRVVPALLGEGFHLEEGVPSLMGLLYSHAFRNRVKGQLSLGVTSNLQLEEDPDSEWSPEVENPLRDLIQRYDAEKKDLVRQLQGQAEEYFSEQNRRIQLVKFNRERTLADSEETFTYAGLLVGLLERQQEEIKFRLKLDRERYERIASKRMREAGDQKHSAREDQPVQSKNVIALLDAIMVLLEGKHIQERQLFCQILDDTVNYPDEKQVAALCSQQQRADKLAELKAARQTHLTGGRGEARDLLCQATVVKLEDRVLVLSSEGGHVTEDDTRTSLMADLLEFQNSEAQRLLRTLSVQSDTELYNDQLKILADKKAGLADNVAMVLFSPEKSDSSTDSDLVEALKGKYDALKDKLLAEALMKQHGEAEWNRLSEKERQRKILELKLKEKQLRKEGRIDEANALLDELLKDQENLRLLMGDSVEEQRRKLQERLQTRRRRLEQGMTEEECDHLEEEERKTDEERERMQQRVILQDLEHRYHQEKDEILQRLYDARAGRERDLERQAQLARLRREQRLSRKEEKFQAAALILGLAEKYDKDLQLKRDAERARQEKLARERLEALKLRRSQGRPDMDEEDMENIVVDTDDPASLQEALARDLDHKQRQERTFFMKLLGEGVRGDNRDAAMAMSDEGLDDKLFELKELHKYWHQSADRELGEEEGIFQEAVGFAVERRKQRMNAGGHAADDDDLQVSLLADLQERQKREAIKFFSEIEDQDLKALQDLHKAATYPKEDGDHSNIAGVLFSDDKGDLDDMDDEADDDDEMSEKKVLRALGQKYDAIRDKLLLEALIKEHGEAEWGLLSEKQRQKKLVELKLKERQLRKEGKLDEIAKLIGSHLEDEKLLDDILGLSKKNQQQRLAERLKRKKQLIAEREAAGLSTDEETITGILDEEEKEEEKRKRRNVLEDLQRNFDDERERIMKALINQTDKAGRERERQIALAKLKLDQRRLQKNDKLDMVALLIANSKADSRKREETIEAERERQRAIARQRLEARKQRKNQGLLDPTQMEAHLVEAEKLAKLEDTVREAEGQSIQEALQLSLEAKQEEEFDLLIALLEGVRGEKQLTAQAKSQPDEELKSALTRIEQEQKKWQKRSQQVAMAMNEDTLTEEEASRHMSDVAANRSDQIKQLTQALVNRLEVERRQLSRKQPELKGDKLEEELEVALVTDLQEKQTLETNAIQTVMKQQDDETLKEIKRLQHLAFREGWFDNLTNTIFRVSEEMGVDTDGEDDVESARAEAEKMDEEFEKEKEEVVSKAKREAKPGEEIDIDAIIAKLKDEHEFHKQKRLSEMAIQRAAIRQKLEARKQAQRNKEYEGLAAMRLIHQAKEQQSLAQEKIDQYREQNTSLLQQRLAQRRDARKEAQSTKLSTVLNREGTLDMMEGRSSTNSRPSTVDSLLPPGSGLRREKTVVDVDVSDEQKQAIMSQLYIQQSNVQRKMAEQQARQEEMLKRRLAMRQSKQQDEAAELLNLGQRQKTILEQSQKDEKERQLQKMKEKVHRMKERREPSPGMSKRK